MSTHHDHNGGGDVNGDDQLREIDLIISRMIDGEASRDDVDAFARAVAADASVGEQLNTTHRNHTLLSAVVNDELDRACRVEIPREQRDVDEQDRGVLVSIVRQAPAYLGWAAAIVLAIILGMGQSNQPEPTQRFIDQDAIEPHVLQEQDVPGALDPMLMNSRELPDGRWQVEIIERRLKILFLDQFDENWIRKATERSVRDDDESQG